MHANPNIWLYIFVMASVTYAIRLVPLLLLRHEIQNPYIRAFLHYVPYATLSAMTFPAAILSAPHWTSGIIGLLTAGVLAFRGISLLPTAAVATLAVWIVESLLR